MVERTTDCFGYHGCYTPAANYLSVGQIHLMDNRLLKEPLQLKQRNNVELS